MQSKVKNPKTETETPIVSLADIGYKASVNIDANMDLASQLMAQDSKFPHEITKETKEALFVGFQRRANEKKGTKYFYASKGALIPVASLDLVPKDKDIEKETYAITVDFVMAQGTHEYGKLKETNKPLYDIVKEIRVAYQKYASDCLGALKTCANKILDQGKPKERKANKNFRESLDFLFNDPKTGLDKKVKTAHAKNDLSSDQVMYLMAKEAFFKVYTKK